MPIDMPAAARPTRVTFDPFNSSATGHQRAENCLTASTAWRDSRSKKLQEQFAADTGGGKRVSDTVGAGSLGFGQDGRKANGQWERGAKGLRTGGQRSLWESMGITKSGKEVGVTAKQPLAKRGDTQVSSTRTEIVNPFTPFRYGDGRVRETSWTAHETSPSELLEPLSPAECLTNGSISQTVAVSRSVISTSCKSASTHSSEGPGQADPKPLQLFRNLVFYVNGSTAPWSDHQIKRLLSQHGGRISVALGRRSVTHVILGKANSIGGSGGGLAGSKIHKEITRIGGKAVRFVTAEWITESIKAGKRQPEARFEALKLAPKGVGSIASVFGAKDG